MSYIGIPFAEPPVGALRLKSPVLKLKPEGTTYDATEFRKGCIQPASDFQRCSMCPRSADDIHLIMFYQLNDMVTNLSAYSEDCLHLSILRPAGLAANISLPVMV